MSNPNNVNNEDEIFDPQEMFVTLDLDDGSQLECQILTIFDVDNQNYIALIPVDMMMKSSSTATLKTKKAIHLSKTLIMMMNSMQSATASMSYWTKKNLIRCKL